MTKVYYNQAVRYVVITTKENILDCNFLAQTPLFAGCTPEEVEGMLGCLGAKLREYKKGEYIYSVGDIVHSMGFVLSGGVNIESNDLWGNTSLLYHVEAGQIFAETYACVPNEPMMVNAVADSRCEVLFLDIGRVIGTCPKACAHHSRLVRNLLAVTAQKNLNLSRRILHTSSKSIRGRLVSYLSFQAERQGSNTVTIPFNRQQLADYLSVDRSAMSNELSKMQKDGLIDVDKNTFVLKADVQS